ncbi:ATP synthase subunit I [Desulfobacterales bacterium HSG16]|nr:ATP synthase subunit I [Desulfobacterales bacterium HSG16]
MTTTIIRQTEKRYSSLAITGAIMAACFFIVIDQKPIAKGLLLGSIFSIINFILMGESLPYRLDHSRRMASAKALGSILFRYTLLAIPLAVSIRFEQFNLFAAIIGIFSVQGMILADHICQYIFSIRNKQIEE